MYPTDQLKTARDCLVVLERAKERGWDEIYKAVFRRYCEIIGSENDDPSDPLVREFHEMLSAYELILFERHGHRQRASYTRRKMQDKGIQQTLVDWAVKRGETPGFTALLDAGMHKLTGEYLVLKYSERFPKDVVAAARQRLISHGVTDLPLDALAHS